MFGILQKTHVSELIHIVSGKVLKSDISDYHKSYDGEYISLTLFAREVINHMRPLAVRIRSAPIKVLAYTFAGKDFFIHC